MTRKKRGRKKAQIHLKHYQAQDKLHVYCACMITSEELGNQDGIYFIKEDWQFFDYDGC